MLGLPQKVTLQYKTRFKGTRLSHRQKDLQELTSMGYRTTLILTMEGLQELTGRRDRDGN